MRNIFRLLKELPEAIFAVYLAALILAIVFLAHKSGFIKDHFPGLLLDILVFGFLIVVFNKLADDRRDIRRWQEEIDDYRNWDEKEATCRIVGNIKRLNKKNFTNINLVGCFLRGAYLDGANLKGARLYEVDLEGAYLANSILQDADFSFAKLQHANFGTANLRQAVLFGANLEGAELRRADLGHADLEKANLRESDLKMANLECSDLESADLSAAYLREANLRGANCVGTDFQKAEGLTLDQLRSVRSLFQAKIDMNLLDLIKEKSPDLLKEAADEKYKAYGPLIPPFPPAPEI